MIITNKIQQKSKIIILLVVILIIDSQFGNAISAPDSASVASEFPMPKKLSDFSLQKIWEVKFNNSPYSVAWNRDGSLIAVYSDYGNTVTVMDYAGSVVSVLPHHGDHFTGSALEFVGDTFLASRPTSPEKADIAFSIQNFRSGLVVRDIPGPAPKGGRLLNWVRAMAISPDQSQIAIVTGPPGEDSITVYSTKTWEIIESIKQDVADIASHSAIGAIAYSSDGHHMAVGYRSTIVIYDLPAYRNSRRIEPFSFFKDGCCISAISFGDGSHNIAVSSSAFEFSVCSKECSKGGTCCQRILPSRQVRLFDFDRNQWFDAENTGQSVWDISSRANDSTVAYISSDFLYVWNPVTGTKLRQPVEGVSIKFSPDGKRLAVCDGRALVMYNLPQL